jgi:hypothetical protein
MQTAHEGEGKGRTVVRIVRSRRRVCKRTKGKRTTLVVPR